MTRDASRPDPTSSDFRAGALFGEARARTELYEAIATTRAVRRLRPDPVPAAVLERLLRAATCAPSGGNAQPWRVLVLRDPERKRALAEHFASTWADYSQPGRQAMERLPEAKRARGMKVMAAGDHLAAHFAEAPLVFVFVHDPYQMAREGPRDPQPQFLFGGSLYPAIQNLLLACRAEGLGGVLTTMSWRREPEILRALAIPEPWRLHAIVPVGYPIGGGHGPIARKALTTMARLDRWDTPFPAPEPAKDDV